MKFDIVIIILTKHGSTTKCKSLLACPKKKVSVAYEVAKEISNNMGSGITLDLKKKFMHNINYAHIYIYVKQRIGIQR